MNSSVQETPYGVRADDVVDVARLYQQVGIEPGMKVVDCGVGREGSFTEVAAQMVGERGTVYALDIVKDVLAHIDDMMLDKGLLNVKTVWTDLEVVGAASIVTDGSADVAVLANTLFQSKQPEMMIAEARRMLREGGRLLLVDWKKQDTVLGPDVERRLKEEDVTGMVEQAGMAILSHPTAGEYHWAIIAQK